MTTRTSIRFTQALVLALATAALATAGVALGSTKPGKPPADTLQRYAAAHPFGLGVIDSRQALDTFERYALAHPFGHGVLDSSSVIRSHRVIQNHIPLIVADRSSATGKTTRKQPATRKAKTVWLIDDWFRDPSSQAPYHRAVKKASPGLIIDDWFRNPK